jgi:hypothetical protein
MASASLGKEPPIEDIPDDDALYKRVHASLFKDGRIMTGAFKQVEMSVDWSKYSTAQNSRDRAKKPSLNGVIELIARDVRQIPGQVVEHAPLLENRSHSLVVGGKNEKTRISLRRASRVVLAVGVP